MTTLIKPITIDAKARALALKYSQPDKSLGLIGASRNNVIVFAEKMLGLKLYTWQKLVLHEIQEMVFGRIPQKEINLVSSRQIGKSTLLAVLDIWLTTFNLRSCTTANNTIIICTSASDIQAKKFLRLIKQQILLGDRYMANTYKQDDGKPIFGDSFFTDLLDPNAPNNTTTISFLPYNEKVHKEYLLKDSGVGSQIISYPPTSSILGETAAVAEVDEAGKTDRITDIFYYEYIYPTGDSTNAIRINTSTPWVSCYDDDTEVLTEEGWKLFKNVDIKRDNIATRDINNNFFFTKATHKIEDTYNGDMYSFNTKTVDLLVTPNHRMVGYFQKGKKRRVIAAEELYKRKTDFWMDTGIDTWVPPKKKDTIVIPSISFNKGNGVHTCAQREVDTKKFLRFIGMYVTDGHYVESGNRVEITQNSGDRLTYYTELLKELFPDLNIKVIPHYESFRIQIHSKQIMQFLKHIKHNGINVWEYTDEQLKHFWQGAWDGDGAKTRSWKNKLIRNTVYMDSKYPKLNECITLVQQRIFGGSVIYYKPVKDSNVQNISGHIATRSKIKTYSNQITKQKYNGNIYCLTVPTGELFVRRNGKSVWSGNSGFFYNNLRMISEERDDTGVAFCFTIDAIKEENPKQYESVMNRIKKMVDDGKMDEVRRAYYCEFIKSDISFFDPEKVIEMFTNQMKPMHACSEPCDMGIDFGGQTISRTVITISRLNKDGIVERIFDKWYEVGEDTTLWEDVIELCERFNIQRIIYDDCAAATYFAQKLIQWGKKDLQGMSFRGEKTSKYTAFRSLLNRNLIRSYLDEDLQLEMLALEFEKGKRTSNIHVPLGYRDDKIDSFIISCYFFLEEDEGLEVFDYYG